MLAEHSIKQILGLETNEILILVLIEFNQLQRK